MFINIKNIFIVTTYATNLQRYISKFYFLRLGIIFLIARGEFQYLSN